MSPRKQILSNRDKRLRNAYGLTERQYEAMVDIQSGKCKICLRRRPYRLHVDHDHKTGRVRGLLCFTCNHRLIGRGLEIPENHERAAAYLRSDFDGRKL